MFSFREKTRSILKANPDLQTKEIVDSSKGKHTFNTIASFFLSKEKNQAQELASQISAYYSAKKPIFEPCDNGRHISSPLSYLLREAQHANMLRSSLDFFASHSDPDSSKAFQGLVETCLRLTSEQQLCSANFHALGRLKSSSPRVFLEAFINIFRENPEVPASTKLATYVQHNLQLLKWNEKTRKTYYEQLLGLPLPITISPSLLLGANKFDALNLIIQDSKKLGLKGIAGRAVYYKIHETPGQGSEEAERLEDLCRKEIANGLDNISTHLSLATLDILYQVNKRPEKVLEAPRPNCDIKTQLLLRHELSLLYLTVDNPDGAAFALDAGNHPFAGKTNYTHISAIVISILLNEVETAETLAHNFLDQGITSLWEEQLHSIYHFALFHALLFRKTKNKIAETHARKLMEETLIPRDDAFRDLIDKIENTGDIPKGSPLFVLAESLEQQLPPLQNSPSTRSA